MLKYNIMNFKELDQEGHDLQETEFNYESIIHMQNFGWETLDSCHLTDKNGGGRS
jgi:hypothetical protein